MPRQSSKMKCQACNEYPAWHRTVDWEAKPTLECALCGNYQQPRITIAKRTRLSAESARLDEIAAWLDKSFCSGVV